MATVRLTVLVAAVMLCSSAIVVGSVPQAFAQEEGDGIAKKGKRGKPGPPGPPGTARAYGSTDVNIGGNEKLVAARSKNITAITRVSLGNYCVTFAPEANIDVATIAPVVSVDFAVSGIFDGLVQFARSSGCAANQIKIVTIDASAAAFTDVVSFTIAVP